MMNTYVEAKNFLKIVKNIKEMIKALIVLLENIYCKIDIIYSINYKQ